MISNQIQRSVLLAYALGRSILAIADDYQIPFQQAESIIREAYTQYPARK